MTTLFTWGYYGWGNHTPQLVKAVAAVEQSRGFQQPIFVDIRIRRTVRAIGFQGTNFEKLLGPSRHRWMKSLGNERIVKKSGPRIQIAEPEAAEELLDLALDAAKDGRRILFFCSCQWPRVDGEITCHRTTVASLLLKAAKKRKSRVEIVEWPGGEPTDLDVGLSPELFRAVAKGRLTIPLGKRVDLATVAGLPWGSIATVHSNGQTLHRLVGPATWQQDQWNLPVLLYFFDPDVKRAQYEKERLKQRRSLGLTPQVSK